MLPRITRGWPERCRRPLPGSSTAFNPARESRPDTPRMATIDAPRRQNPLRQVLASQQAGLVLVILLLAPVLTLSRRLARRSAHRADGQQLPQLLHPDPDRHRRELLRHHGGRRDGGDHLRRHRPLGRIGLRAGGRHDRDGAARARTRRRRAADGRCWRSACALGVGLACGADRTALLVVGLGVHPFIITLGTMWILRGIAFVASNAESILLPQRADARGQGVARTWRRRSIRCRCS